MAQSLDSFLPYRLSRLSEAVSGRIRPIYRDMYGLNRPEWRVLAALADMERATATEICAHSAQHKTKVSRAVRALEVRRWLKRRTDPRDRRSEILSLTDAGRAAFDALIVPLRACEADILSALDAEALAALGTALGALEDALEIDGGSGSAGS